MVQSLDDARRRSRPAGGRVPPHDLAAEESLLGAMLLSKDAIAAAVEGCTVDDFYKPAHGHIFEAVCSLYGQGQPIDPVTVADELRRAGLLEAVGGEATLIGLQARTPATTSAARYARIVADHAVLRRLIGVANEIAEMGYDVPDDVTDTIDRAETLVFGVAERKLTNTVKPLRDLLVDSLDRLESLYERGETITGVPTGYNDLDEQLSGLQKNALIIVGARPAMGKAQPVATPVLTPSGWRPIGSLIPGDHVVGADGAPTVVRAVFPQGTLPVHRVSLADGTSTVACGEHLWAVLQDDDDGDVDVAADKPWGILTTAEIAESLGRGLSLRLPTVATVAHPHADLPVDAYLAGVAIGDRFSPGGSGDPAGEASDAALGRLGLGGQRCDTGFVPDAYLHASPEQRLGVLQGLLDAAGHYRHGSAVFVAAGPRLAADVAELARSLGGGARTVATGCAAHQVELRLPPGMAPFRRPRKLDAWAGDGGWGEEHPPGRRIVAVEAAGPEECVCILVDNADHLYVTENHIVTHNTSFALGIAAHAATKTNTPALVFSLEMSHSEITQRLLCAEAQVDANRMRNGKLQQADWSKISHAIGRLGEAPLYIDDSPNVTIMDIRAKARRLKSRENLGLIVIDYLQLMTGRSSAENRQVEVSEISRGLKILARELEVPVVALSQLSRQLETRADKRPMLADLRESGSLEQDADVVMFIYRDEVYNAESPDRGIAEIIVAKHRNGPTGSAKLAFLDHYARFANMARV